MSCFIALVFMGLAGLSQVPSGETWVGICVMGRETRRTNVTTRESKRGLDEADVTHRLSLNSP